MSKRWRLAALVGVVVLAVVGAIGYVAHARSTQDAARANAPKVPTRDDLTAVAAAPHLVFRSTALGDTYGRVALVPLTAPGGPRAVTGTSCERVYATANKAVCLSANRGLATTYRAQLLGADWTPQHDLPLAGIPSRARLSRDGSLVATTTFVYGHDYANPGQFSTETLITRGTGEQVDNVEKFELVIGGRVNTATDRNVWGVTFADDDRFYATVATGHRTWLVVGSVSARKLTALREDAECPSLSPDLTRIAFKKHGDLAPGHWRLAVYDLATGKETLLAETRSIDDQVEWLNDSRVVYGLPRTGAAAATSDVWTVAADGGGSAAVLVPDAWSPAVVR
jgi:hypothetical protein